MVNGRDMFRVRCRHHRLYCGQRQLSFGAWPSTHDQVYRLCFCLAHTHTHPVRSTNCDWLQGLTPQANVPLALAALQLSFSCRAQSFWSVSYMWFMIFICATQPALFPSNIVPELLLLLLLLATLCRKTVASWTATAINLLAIVGLDTDMCGRTVLASCIETTQYFSYINIHKYIYICI